MINQKKIKNFYLLILMLVLGCAPLSEEVRRFAGFSVHHLEKHRDSAIKQNFSCEFSDCYDVVLAIGKNSEEDPQLKKHFEIFQFNKEKGYVVFYAIPDQIDTTEVAVFITPENSGSLVEVVSLSSFAKEKVATVVFEELKANDF